MLFIIKILYIIVLQTHKMKCDMYLCKYIKNLLSMLLNFNYNLRGRGSASGIKCVLLYHVIWKIITGITDFSNMQERRPFLTWFTLGRYSHFSR